MIIKMYTLTNLRKFYMWGMLAGLNVWLYTNVHSLMMGQ
jgi:hypothetical protein